MAELLLNKIVNEEIPASSLTRWIFKSLPEEDQDFKDISACNIGQIDFITYFLNFLHEELLYNIKLSQTQTPLKFSTPKKIDKPLPEFWEAPNVSIKDSVKANLFEVETSEVQKSNPGLSTSFSTSLHTSQDKTYTPNVSRKFLNKSENNYFSPISPLYENPNKFVDSNASKLNSSNRNSVCLGDFLVTTIKSSAKKKRHSVTNLDVKKETSRRINPTSISFKRDNNSFQKTENSFNFQEQVEEVSVKTSGEQRNLLVQERDKILSRKDSIEHSTNAVLLKRHNSLSKSDVTPRLSMVTFKNNIHHVVNVYTTILDHKLVLNITSEIYFIISLFLRQQSEDSINKSLDGIEELNSSFSENQSKISPNEKISKVCLSNLDIFDSIHNVVYFAVKCLEAQAKTLKLYDKTTIRLLAENERLKEFAPKLSNQLLNWSEKKTEKTCIEVLTPQTIVCFNIDTDNLQNFPDQSSFHAFKKQRDLFYEILRIWEMQHLSTDWNFSQSLGGKIRSLFSFHGDPTNYVHLARLFKKQLLGSCANGPKEKGLSELSLSFLPSVGIDANKLNRLTNRLVTKQASNGINSLPVFSGYQEFFKDFIVAASNGFFNRHLCDTIIVEIIEVNDTKFLGNGLDDQGQEVDSNTRKLYINCIKKLRILAKFLGFIESLPYKSELANLSKNVLEAQLNIRSQIIPSLNIKLLLQTSIEKHTVIFIIPWLTKYLAMLDYVTLRLPYYMSVHSMLFDLYQNYDTFQTTRCNAAVVKFCLGWLFELPHFPDVEYFNFCSKSIDKSKKKEYNGISGIQTKLKPASWDFMNIVDQSVLYLCCPYLEEIKKILSTNAPGSKMAAKYITPVTAVESNSEMTKKKLEQQLEEAFFSGQPTSLRKTVEFVSERIASTAVKYICHDLVPKAKELALIDLKENVLKGDIINKFDDDQQKKMALKKSATTLAQRHLSKLLQTCEVEMQKISDQKIPPSIINLLPIDALEQTQNTCVAITHKVCVDRVNQWLKSHVNLTVFMKDIDSAIQKFVNGIKKTDKEKVPLLLPGTGRNCDHNDNTLSGFHALNYLREACCTVTENDDANLDYVLNVLHEIHRTLTQRNDVNDMISAAISMTVFDFYLLIVAASPSLLSKPSDNVVQEFIKIWSLQPKTNMSFFKALFCQRNIKILNTSKKSLETWDVYAKTISYLLNKKLVDQDDLESQCTGFYNRDWDEDILGNFSHFLKNLVTYTDSDGSHKFAYLLDFLSDFCSDL